MINYTAAEHYRKCKGADIFTYQVSSNSGQNNNSVEPETRLDIKETKLPTRKKMSNTNKCSTKSTPYPTMVFISSLPPNEFNYQKRPKHYTHSDASEIGPTGSAVEEFQQPSVKEWHLTWRYNHPADCLADQLQPADPSPV
jgi:hypothetical protein